jgi:hypothetical protein
MVLIALSFNFTILIYFIAFFFSIRLPMRMVGFDWRVWFLRGSMDESMSLMMASRELSTFVMLIRGGCCYSRFISDYAAGNFNCGISVQLVSI